MLEQTMTNELFPQRRYVWGRQQSRPLKDRQSQALRDLFPQVSLALPKDNLINLSELFASPLADLWVEIGFGQGEHLSSQAIDHPNIGFIGCEPFINGVASLVVKIQELSLKNIRIVKDDARLLMARLPDQCVGKLFILFPDPWPKKRHHKRRIIQDSSVATFARILKPGGILTMATDDAPYAEWIQDIMKDHKEFEFQLEGRSSVYERPQGWFATRYEKKGIAQGRNPVYLVYKLKG